MVIKMMARFIGRMNVVLILTLGLLLRLVLASWGTLDLDQGTYIAWSRILTQRGFLGFYDGWSDYLPGYLYILWLLGKVSTLKLIPDEVLYKLPAIIGDLVCGYLIFRIVKSTKAKKWAKYSLIAFLFNPAVISNSTLWGQVDILSAVFMIASLWFVKKNIVLSVFLLAYGTLVKPQVAFVLPAVLWVFWEKKVSVERVVFYGFLGFMLFMVGFFLFWNGDMNFMQFVFLKTKAALDQYQYTSVNAFNFWAVFGMWKSDVGKEVFNLRHLGYVFSALGVGVVGLQLIKHKKDWGELSKYYLGAGSVFSVYVFMTRMHERHMLPVLPFLLILGTKRKELLGLYAVLSGVYILNMFYSYTWITQDFYEVIGRGGVVMFSVVVVISFLYFVFFDGVNRFFWRLLERKGESWTFSKPIVSRTVMRWILFSVLVFALFSRVFWLNEPKNEYFDEVYHAFTAREMLHGKVAAWGWWSQAPERFAYEWTHPPLAKLGMVVGMMVFGENALGWRMPGAILGFVSVMLVYLIAKTIFKDEWVGILAAVFSLEGLVLVMSRIGMNDIYFLTFMLASFYFLLKKKYFWSAFCLGLAGASKWSVVWFVPIVFVVQVGLRRKLVWNNVWFLIVPPLVYLASYLPLLFNGLGFDTFVGVQKQMWWYHTRLSATHPYTSPWWSWPFLMRPIWLYTGLASLNRIKNIYAFGNPVVFWGGIIAMVVIFYKSLVIRERRLGVVVFSYLMFFVSWSLSPRIMFIYHYLPSLPFLAIALGVVLRRYQKIIVPFFLLALIVFVYFYPHWAGFPVPRWLDNSYYWFSSWK